jgi:hypothetical protein
LPLRAPTAALGAEPDEEEEAFFELPPAWPPDDDPSKVSA